MTDERYQLLLKVTWYYYMENYTQQQISNLVGVSRGKVIRLLDEAKSEGIIRFLFRNNDTERMQLEKKLIEQFGLHDAFIVPTPDKNSALVDSIAKAAAMYVAEHLETDDFLNIGYGDMVGLMLQYLTTARHSDINVVSLTGGVSYYLPKVGSQVFAMNLYLTPAPLILSTAELRNTLEKETAIQDVYRMTKHANMTIVGIGSMDEDATTIRNGILNKTDLALLKMKGAVGDILMHFIDSDGNPVDNDSENRIMSTSLKKLQEMKNVVGVAGGKVKVPAIHAVLKHGYLNVLITDEKTAWEILKYGNDSDELSEVADF